MTFDDYFDDSDYFRDYEIVFPEYAKLKFNYEKDNNYWKYFECIRTHILVFSYNDYYKGELAIVLDGTHKDEVVYLWSEGCVTVTYTHKTFLEWLTDFYSHAMKKCALGNKGKPYVRYIFFLN